MLNWTDSQSYLVAFRSASRVRMLSLLSHVHNNTASCQLQTCCARLQQPQSHRDRQRTRWNSNACWLPIPKVQSLDELLLKISMGKSTAKAHASKSISMGCLAQYILQCLAHCVVAIWATTVVILVLWRKANIERFLLQLRWPTWVCRLSLVKLHPMLRTALIDMVFVGIS